MNERISRADMLLEVAAVIAKRGTCERLTVGAVIARDGRILSSGYNGAPKGLDHCGPLHCQLDRPCTWATHAEMNAITAAANAGVATHGATMYCTDSPCVECAKAIINAGIADVHFRRKYRLVIGLELLTAAGIGWEHHELA